MKIIVKLSSGIGNQLFMLAFYKHIEGKYGVRPYFDDKYFQDKDNIRKPELAVVMPDYPVCHLPFNPAGEHHLKRKCYEWVWSHMPFVTRISEDCYDDDTTYRGRLLYFDGYWQTPRYVEDLDRSLFMPVGDMPEVLASEREHIRKAATPVSLHVRRGDYFTLQYIDRFGVCDEAYYQQAMEAIEAQLGQVTYFVFSDDLPWVQQHLTFRQPVHYVANYDVNSYWYIHLMSLCRHHIISNSTFSWWGAYLDDREGKLVVGPSRWTLDSERTLMLEKWEKVIIPLSS